MTVGERIGAVLRHKKLIMGTAESCTGGYIAHLVTAVPGSSDYFAGGIVSYANEVKQQLLGVSPLVIDRFGAVSRQVVEQMAGGAIRVLNCDCAVATSGIAGPAGGTEEKPVGTVWIAAAYKDRIVSECFHFGNVREENIRSASRTALEMLIRLLEKEITPF